MSTSAPGQRPMGVPGAVPARQASNAPRCDRQRGFEGRCRKSRAKRERPEVKKDVVSAPSSLGEREAVNPALPTFPLRQPARQGRVGARVARVAVDDETWTTFQELRGETPASARLAQSVEAEVLRAREVTSQSEAVAAVRPIRAHADQLETFIRDARGWVL
jgi:hypothetical protein